MRYTHEGEHFRVPVVFSDAFNTLIPDPGSVNLTIHDPEGTPVVEEQGLDTGGGTHLVYEVTDGSALILQDDTIATRYQITARYMYEGGLYEGRVVIPYTVIKFAAHGATAQAVRDLLGLTKVEMPDAGIDLDLAYLNTAWEVGETQFDDGLKAGGRRSEGCRGAVVAKAAQALLPSLSVRLAQELVDGSRQFSRFSAVDFDKLTAYVNDVYTYNLARLQGTGTGEPPLGFFTTGTLTDLVTGG